MKFFHYLLALCVLSFLPLISMFTTSDIPHTSDGAMHAIRFGAYFTELMQGQFPVRWTQQFHYGYGTPLFNFIAPLPYIFSIPFIALGFTLTETLKFSFLFTFLLGGIFMFTLANRIFKSYQIAFFVAIMYQFAPFRLVEMNVRGNLGSLYAYAFVPLFFYSILCLLDRKNHLSITLTAISIFLLCLSHTILGYVFIGLGLIFIVFQIKDRSQLIVILIAVFLGFGLAAFFVIPGIIEQKYTNGYLFSKDVFYDHFPELYKFLLPNFLNSKELRVAEISVQIGLFHVLLFLLLLFIFIKKTYTKNEKYFVIFIITITIGTIIFMQPIAKPLWENITIIRQFQFPWRFLGVIIFLTSISAGFVLNSFPIFKSNRIYTFIVLLVIVSTAYYWKPTQGFDKPTEHLFWNYPLTTNYFSEVNSVWMGEEPIKPALTNFEVVANNPKVVQLKRTSILHHYYVTTNQKSLVVDYSFYFPGWKVEVNGKAVPIQFQDPNYRGLITFELEPGNHSVKITFAQSKIQQLGNSISLISILLLMFSKPLLTRIKL